MKTQIVKSHEELQKQLKKAAIAFAKSDDYHHLRPKYTVESAEYLLRKVGVFSGDNEVILSDTNGGPVTVIELGCGTGLLTLAMVAALRGKENIRYIATDPTKSMSETFEKMLPEVEFVACKAEDLPFPDSSVRAFVAGASFHWFANQKAYEELYRVLEPSGMLGYVSNLPSEKTSADWVKEMYFHLWDSYKRTGAPFEHDYEWREALLASGLFIDYEEDFSLDYHQEVTLEECIQCFTSFGGVASGGSDNQRNFSNELAKILKQHFTDKGVEFPGIQHTTEIYTSRSKKTK
ncbi:uncharacterized methyltransferase-like C25B8.10 isoform X2 [Actinia tenebrosa]|nr:uncharacterized methyltransferase-like C25B8.10 isoform X2 [Actinia tenebrosa]XP_031553256.1 uncharacterized methyltransferase-like C25B8.10 isoform X2 [Actinia tenebrosa]XP_031553257.1 uncharacterized methyltransferase-like C25B8.10 isoform X2 [Actinia tenebrosa]XP_031553258.1 uncharacterized methyltransferase-like C25B8.10 isoform X2 [Actinia tenebrosa]